MTRISIAKVLALYTVLGAGLGVVIVVLVGVAQSSVSTSDLVPLSAQDFGFLLVLWLIAMIPAGVAAALLILNMIAFPLVRERRMVRSAIAAGISLMVSASFFALLSDGTPGIGRLGQLASYGLVGALPAALIAYFCPKGSAPMPSNNSFERTREG